ncbi:MAG TPA: hypothetical protein VE934_16285 [Polaromonas sp.]|uniref:hypothetical protein n=1 Tax=Polaromonas sp. TaxID=1869339 RepID=UPI002D4EB277|nr:hypothetical protein [Polaromonas sp.]HYW58513.1 hypothetical protein [Polaromonas sp.]
MQKLTHQFVTGVRADTEVEYGFQGSKRVRWDDLHIQQSELDGACGVVCSLQCAMILEGLKREDVEEISNAKTGPLQALWKLASTTYFEGTDEKQIDALIGVFKPRLRSKSFSGGRTKELAHEIAEAIDAGHVPILCLEHRSWRHWTLVVGLEISDKKAPRALLCLDASNSRPPWGVFYNARCSLQHSSYGKNRKPKKYSLQYATVDGGLCNVRLSGLVIVKRGLTAVQ